MTKKVKYKSAEGKLRKLNKDAQRMNHHTALPIQLAPPHRVETYDQAWLYCLTLVHKGYKDWRMPTFEEWRVSYDSDIRNASYCKELTSTYYTKTCVSPVRDI